MLSLKAKIRDKFGRKTNYLREQGVLPAVLYGTNIDNLVLEISENEFEKVFQEAGETSLISLEIGAKKYEVLVHALAKDPIKGKITHVDFYCPLTTTEVTVNIPLLFENEEITQKNSGGNLIKEFQEIEVKGLSKDLPKEIIIDLSVIKGIGDKIQVKDLKIPENVQVLKELQDTVAVVVAYEEFKEEEKQATEEKETIEQEQESKN